ncbi:putative serine/threonine-protein kinase PBL28 isoform X2 [Primulina tabacum]|uniref:putative serine/threonine-protein kinase PBL28 isoform X2 n=1 Tax=Primulina tabacum TaxID=48773 RepID=UPI003F59DC00
MSLIGLVSAQNKLRRSKSEDQFNPWIYKPLEYWKNECGIPPAESHNASSVFTLREMAEATCSFRDENLLLGMDGFGRVHKVTVCSGGGYSRYGVKISKFFEMI